MNSNQLELLKSKRFLPLLLTQFMVAFNDNFFRNALITFITFKTFDIPESSKSLMVTISIGLFMLPYFLFSTTGGQLANKYNKAQLIRWIKILEIFVMSLAAVGFMLNDIYFLMFVLFLMGAQSALFGPVKYSILPDHLSNHELIGANGFVEASTFLSILLGTVFGAMVILSGTNILMAASILVVAFAVLGFITSLFIPDTPALHPEKKVSFNLIKETKEIFVIAKKDRNLYYCIIAISWAWMIGAVFLSQIYNVSDGLLKVNGETNILLLSVFTIGIGFGSLICNTILKGEISSKYVPITAVLMTIFIADFTYAIDHFEPLDRVMLLHEFLNTFSGWRIIVDMTAVAALGGIYMVPLYAILQAQSEEKERSQIIAANNIINAVFMVLSSIASMIILKMSGSVVSIFFLLTLTHAFMTAWIFYRVR